MRKMTVLATAGAVAVTVGVISFTFGRTLSVQEPVATGTPVKIAEPELVTGTIASRPLPVQAQPQAPSTPPVVSPAAFSAPDRTNVAAASSPACGNPDALGISRVVEIDTAGGPGFGFEHFKAYDFLSEHEVVLTFDDGPWPGNTLAVLKALADQCTKALFFPIGKHALWHPEILKQVAAAGHTIGSHTWSHADLSKLTIEQAKEEFEKGASAVRAALGEPGASFFRFPALRQPPEMVTYLGTRNIGIFSTDMDSFDFKTVQYRLGRDRELAGRGGKHQRASRPRERDPCGGRMNDGTSASGVGRQATTVLISRAGLSRCARRDR